MMGNTIMLNALQTIVDSAVIVYTLESAVYNTTCDGVYL